MRRCWDDCIKGTIRKDICYVLFSIIVALHDGNGDLTNSHVKVSRIQNFYFTTSRCWFSDISNCLVPTSTFHHFTSLWTRLKESVHMKDRQLEMAAERFMICNKQLCWENRHRRDSENVQKQTWTFKIVEK